MSQFSEIEIDGVVQPNVVSSYTFNTTGEHTVKYTLVNNTSIGEGAFNDCSSMTSVIIPNSVTLIGSGAFQYCSGLTSIIIPNSVTSINAGAFYGCSSMTSVTIGNSVSGFGYSVFYDCSSLTEIISLATTAPIIQNNTFQSIKANGTLIVPVGSTGYNVWMGNGDYYLGKYNWTKVEQ